MNEDQMKIVRKDLSTSREVKLSYDYKVIEQLTEEYLEKYAIDNTVETWLTLKLQEIIDWDEVKSNLTSSKKNYKLQFDLEVFKEFTEVVSNEINKCMQIELDFIKKHKSEAEAQRLEKIMDNILDPIPLTMFEHGIQRVTLVSYHYFLKVIDRLAKDFLEANEIKNINGTKNPTELFIRELYDIIAYQDELTKFTLTLKSLIEQWLVKYNNKTKIGEFYYDILMITPEYIIEKILKYMMFTAIRNKNPFTLRAIFSSYLTLIHKNLFSFYATNLTKIKLGYFKQLEGLFTENFDLIFDQGLQSEPKKFIINSMIFSHIMKNKRYIRRNFHLMDDEYIQHFFEPNYFDAFSSYRINSMPFIDHLYFYSTSLKFTNNSVLKESKYHKISSSFFKKSNIKKNRLIIKELLNKHLWKYFFDFFKDPETVDEIFEAMAKDLIQKLNVQHYLDDDFKPLQLSFDEYLNTIEKFVVLMKKTLERG